MHILVYERNAYTQADLIDSLKKSGITLSTFTYNFENKNKDEIFLSTFTKELKQYHYDAVLSINYYPLIAECCYLSNTKYLSWSYDCPLDVRNIEDTLGFPTNYVFLFDKIQVDKYLNMGFENIYHLPLAVNTNRLDRMKPSASDYHNYGGDIAFVGNLYESPYSKLIEPLPDYVKGYLDGICESQLILYGCFFLDHIITSDIINLINNIYQQKYPNINFKLIKEELSYTMATQITHNERIRLLQAISKIPDIQTNLYSTNTLNNASIIQKGIVDYLNQMPYVFKTNKINLNITLKCIQSGIPLRAMDILGCGSFLLTNYQPELAEYFIPNIDFVSYGSIEEAVDLAYYYLAHESKRNKIAIHGYESIKKQFTYQIQLEKLFNYAKL